jgi:hypothetical protein
VREERRPSAFLDASALYPALLRNILMRLAVDDLFRAFWSERVQDEWTQAIFRDRPDLPRAQIERTRRLMDEAGSSRTRHWRSVAEFEFLPTTTKARRIWPRVLEAPFERQSKILKLCRTKLLCHFPINLNHAHAGHSVHDFVEADSTLKEPLNKRIIGQCEAMIFTSHAFVCKIVGRRVVRKEQTRHDIWIGRRRDILPLSIWCLVDGMVFGFDIDARPFPNCPSKPDTPARPRKPLPNVPKTLLRLAAWIAAN